MTGCSRTRDSRLSYQKTQKFGLLSMLSGTLTCSVNICHFKYGMVPLLPQQFQHGMVPLQPLLTQQKFQKRITVYLQRILTILTQQLLRYPPQIQSQKVITSIPGKTPITKIGMKTSITKIPSITKMTPRIRKTELRITSPMAVFTTSRNQRQCGPTRTTLSPRWTQ